MGLPEFLESQDVTVFRIRCILLNALISLPFYAENKYLGCCVCATLFWGIDFVEIVKWCGDIRIVISCLAAVKTREP